MAVLLVKINAEGRQSAFSFSYSNIKKPLLQGAFFTGAFFTAAVQPQ